LENYKILIVDDDKEILDLIAIYMSNEGYKVFLANDGYKAIEVVENNKIDLIILDIMMPKLDGISTCMKIREKYNMPIIMLTAKSQDMDKVNGLTIGADDYVTKPFNPVVLVARVKSQLRRYKVLNGTEENNSIIEIDDLIVNNETHEVKVRNKDIKLTPREFGILKLLAENQGVVFSIGKIYERVWQEQFFEAENTVMVHIRKIRSKIEEDPRKPRFIKTVWGVGYKIERR